ncbi:MAG: MFS transporter [SAR202 cluster bacterium]|nr:MFS transporter [SAR202 cluster bacterium]
MLAILRHPKYRFFFANTLCRDLGVIVFFVSNGWLALTLTDSPFWVGATAGSVGVGLAGFSVFGGVLADRLDRKKLLMGAQVWMAVVATVMAALVATGRVELWHLMLAGFSFGVSNAVELPSRNAFTMDLMGRGNLLRGVATNFVTAQIMGIAAPIVAGQVLEAFDDSWAYVVVAGSNMVAVTMLLPLRYQRPAVAEHRTPLRDLREGLAYGFRTPLIRGLILLGITGEVFGWSHETMLPVMAGDVLKVGAAGLGYMLSAAGAGSLAFTLVLANLRDIRRKGLVAVVAAAGFGLFLVAFAYSPWFSLSLLLIALAYGMGHVYEAVVTTALQTAVPDGMRGRVLSFQTAVWGISSLAGFVAGAIANALGAPAAIAIGGGVLVVSALSLMPMASRLRERPEAKGELG